jgi:protein-S-isoprenylcysteine O-methyltransferase Ste14
MYSGASLTCVGLGLAAGSPLTLAVWGLPIVALVRRIGVEEQMLREALGAAYDEYADGRARLVPRLW